MRFTKTLSVIFFGLLLCTQPAKADVVFGADFYRTFIDTDRETELLLSDKYDNIAAVLGFDINGVGLEGFYKTYNEQTNDYGVNSKIEAYGADFVLRLPTSEVMDFIGSAGYIRYNFDLDNDTIYTDGLRVGFGLQFNLTENIGIRAMYHYTSLTKEVESIKTINEISAGIRIKF